MTMKKLPTIHHLIFALCPVLFLYVHNLRNAYISLPRIVLYCCLSLFLAEILYLFVKLILKNVLKASIIVSSFLIFIFFFPYGYVFDQPVIFVSFLLAYFLSLFAFIAIYFTIVKTRKDLGTLTHFLNFSSLFLILIIIGDGILFSIDRSGDKNQDANKFVHSQKSSRPDIYYIILDAYARQDVLQKLYGYDNSKFINSLRQRGFFVADKSCTNYNLTLASLASSLNFDYLDQVSQRLGESSPDKRPLIEMIKNSKIRNFLSMRGYRFISLSSYGDTSISDSDFNITSLRRFAKISEFESILFKNNLIGFISKKHLIRFEYLTHKTKINLIFDQLPLVAAQPCSVFVFAHVGAPHPPFVFSGKSLAANYIFADGSELHHNAVELQKLYAEAYCEQIDVLNQKILAVIDKILARINKESIIIIQSDHGPRLQTDWSNPANNSSLIESMSILNAIYMPKRSTKDRPTELNDKTTPVNTFRVILKRYFAENIELLENRSYAVMGLSKPYKHVLYKDDAVLLRSRKEHL